MIEKKPQRVGWTAPFRTIADTALTLANSIKQKRELEREAAVEAQQTRLRAERHRLERLLEWEERRLMLASTPAEPSEPQLEEREKVSASEIVRGIERLIPRHPTLGGGKMSTADELRKWAMLRDEGLVTEEEFLRMRGKLIGL